MLKKKKTTNIAPTPATVQAKAQIKIEEGQQARYRLFAKAYAYWGNASKAAKVAGFTPKTAANQGWRLLHRDDVRQMIAEEQERAYKAIDISPDKILHELAAIAFSSPLDFFEEREDNELRFKKIEDINIRERAALSQIETYCGEDGIGRLAKVRTWSKEKALEALMKYKEMIRPPAILDLGSVVEAIEDARLRLKRARQQVNSDDTNNSD